MKAVITAGGRIDGAFAQAAGTAIKALAPIGDTTMLARAIEALRGCGVSRIAVVGGTEVQTACSRDVERVIDESQSGSENMLRALRAWPEDGETLLYSTSDLPYIDTPGVRGFIERVQPGTLGLPLTEHADYERRFPDAPAAGITLAGDRVINGGVFSLPPGSADRVAAVAGEFFDARKHPWRMARTVGPLALIRFALRRLSVGDLERIGTRVLGFPARAIRNCAPELAFDVDGAPEYAYASERR